MRRARPSFPVSPDYHIPATFSSPQIPLPRALPMLPMSRHSIPGPALIPYMPHRHEISPALAALQEQRRITHEHKLRKLNIAWVLSIYFNDGSFTSKIFGYSGGFPCTRNEIGSRQQPKGQHHTKTRIEPSKVHFIGAPHNSTHSKEENKPVVNERGSDRSYQCFITRKRPVLRPGSSSEESSHPW